VRVRHDDEQLRPHSPKAAMVMSAMALVGTLGDLRTIPAAGRRQRRRQVVR